MNHSVKKRILPKVSVCIVTYNHAEYISEAIHGVLMQKSNFIIELIIANDCSTDNTNEVVKNILLAHSNLESIIYLNSPKNLGMLANFKNALDNCSGKYIALCDGDDYWTDPLKLQKQIDFLENNPDYNICFHDVNIYNQEKQIIEKNVLTREVPKTTTINDLAKGNFIHTPSVVFRNDFILPKWFSKVSIADWTLHMIVVKDKKIKKLEDVMAVYRIHSQSIWSLKTEEFRIKNTIKSFKLVMLLKDLRPETKEVLKKTIKDLESHLSVNSSFVNKLLNKIKRPFSV